MAYKTPTDLPQVPPVWTDWPLAERVKTAALVELGVTVGASPAVMIPHWAKQAAVAVTLVEQPKRIPNGNCCGIMPFGSKRPWGWREEQWKYGAPIGYALHREGMSGLVVPFLAFESPMVAMRFLIARCIKSIWDGPTYARSWFGGEPLGPGAAAYAQAVKGFNAASDKVLAELWRRAAL